jgi:beta-galactosidase
MKNKFRFGTDYYPEQWDETRWEQDATLMQAAGFNVVRLAEFAWAKMEPSEGQFDFDWLDRAIGILASHGIDVVLGTPTASPPPWVMVQDPNLFLTDANGVRRTYGLRREYCPSHPLYRQHSQRIVAAMAEHFKDNLAIIGWQIDNELGDRCYCDTCRAEFHKWLKAKYQTLDTLNEKWGTIFWSHTYSDWSQIPVPLTTALPNTPVHNPGLALDYRRFMSDTYCTFQKLQIDILRQHCPNHFVTHNLMGFGYSQLDYFDLAADLDHVSWDIYPRHQWDMTADVDPARTALSCAAMRGLKKQNYWVMEQQSGGGGWDMLGVLPKPGELRLWTYQTIAHGADAILYFRWRTARFGTEQNWHGILDHHGIPGRRYIETAQVGQELQKIGDLLAGSQIRSQVAIMQSYDSRFALQGQPNHPHFSYENHIQDIYRGFHHHNISVDIVSEKDLLTGYKLVIVPAMYVLTEQTATHLEKFAAEGGTVVFTVRTGVKDEFNAVVDMKLPGLVAKMCGIEVEEYISMPPELGNKIQFNLPELNAAFPTSTLADVLEPKGAQVIARHIHDFYAGKPAATLNQFGKGKVIYLGALGDGAYYDSLAGSLSDLAGIQSLLETPAGVEITERWQGDQCLLFILNHNPKPQRIQLLDKYRDLLDDKNCSGEIVLAPNQVLILSKQATRR